MRNLFILLLIFSLGCSSGHISGVKPAIQTPPVTKHSGDLNFKVRFTEYSKYILEEPSQQGDWNKLIGISEERETLGGNAVMLG